MLILSFRSSSPGIPFLDVCGLPLAVRGAMDGVKSGYTNILLLVHVDDQKEARKVISSYSSLSGVRIVSSMDGLLQALVTSAEHPDSTIAVVSGNGVWSVDFLAELRSAPNGKESTIGVRSEGPFTVRHIPPARYQEFAISLFTKPTSLIHATTGAGPPELWYPINSPDDVPGAEDFLISRMVKKTDGIISRNINRKISLTITRRLMKTAIRPNHITAVVFVIGVLSGPVTYFSGNYPGLVVGGLLYYLAAILDGCDGELSRLKFMGTPHGAWLDTVVDDTVGLSYIVGLYLSLANQSVVWGWVGGTAVFFYLLTLGPRYFVMAFFLGTGDYQKLSASKSKPSGKGIFAKIRKLLEDTVCRTDFIPFAAFITACIDASYVFGGVFFLGTVGSAFDSLYTFHSMKKTSQAGVTG